MYKPYHLIGLELGLSVASVVVRGEPTGTTRGFSGDVVATAKRDLSAGERLDGEGGHTVYGRLMPAADSLRAGGLPIGLAHDLVLTRPVAAGRPVSWDDVAFDPDRPAIRFRREMEDLFRGRRAPDEACGRRPRAGPRPAPAAQSVVEMSGCCEPSLKVFAAESRPWLEVEIVRYPSRDGIVWTVVAEGGRAGCRGGGACWARVVPAAVATRTPPRRSLGSMVARLARRRRDAGRPAQGQAGPNAPLKQVLAVAALRTCAAYFVLRQIV